MHDIPLLGAIKKGTNDYVYPAVANKSDDHICPECRRGLILRKGSIRVHHFAHCKSDDPCTHYSRPSEAQIHKDAKMLLKTLLDNKTPLKIITKCDPSCPDSISEYEIPEKSETSKIIIEYGFDYNGRKIADVAYLDNGNIVCIFEVYNTHQTKPENRPEPWFELDATGFINAVNMSQEIQCIRKRSCEKCELVACSSSSDICLTFGGKSPKWVLDLNNGYCTACKINIEDQKLREIEREEAQRKKELADLRRRKSAEVIQKLRADHKKCIKCKSYDRCKRCSDRIWKTHNTIIEEFMNSYHSSTNEVQS